MSFQAMPFLFVNMGGEMAYILEQRLQAQNVGNEKSTKVLCDILAVMLSKSFLDELFEPQEIMTRQGLRQFFEQIAHSSVMRLNEASMDKLFDLMTMAVKYQFLLCKEPSELVLVTMNHLDGMKAIFKGHPTILGHIDYANTLLMDNFGDTPLWQMSVIRSELLNFLHGARVKVSLMLREGRQLDDGRFVLFPGSEKVELPYNAVVPGSVRYVENGALVRSEQFPVEEQFKVSPGGGYQDRTMVRGTTLGQNMYRASGELVQQQNKETLTAEAETKLAEQRAAASSGATGDELGLLSLLITGDKAGRAAADDFELDLFEDEEAPPLGAEKAGKKMLASGEGKKKKEAVADKQQQPMAKRSSLNKAINEMCLDKGDNVATAEKPPSRKGARKGKDLLDMMDQEAKKPPPALTRKRSESAKRGGTQK